MIISGIKRMENVIRDYLKVKNHSFSNILLILEEKNHHIINGSSKLCHTF